MPSYANHCLRALTCRLDTWLSTVYLIFFCIFCFSSNYILAEETGSDPDDILDGFYPIEEDSQAIEPSINIERCIQSVDETAKWFDRSHAYLSRQVCKPVVWVDKFFMVKEDEYGENFNYNPASALFRVTIGADWFQNQGAGFQGRFKGRFDLPNMSKRFKLIVSGQRDVEEEENDAALGVAPQENEQTFSTALRWVIDSDLATLFDYDIGLRFDNGPIVFTRVRMRKIFNLSDDTFFRITETLRFRDREGFGETTSLDLEHRLSNHSLMGWSGDKTFSEQSRGVDWAHTFYAFHRYNSTKAIRAELSQAGVTRPATTTENFRLRVRYRQNFLRPWLFLEAIPEINYPKVGDFENELLASVIVRFEVLLGDLTL